jgi:hypothetical protein
MINSTNRQDQLVWKNVSNYIAQAARGNELMRGCGKSSLCMKRFYLYKTLGGPMDYRQEYSKKSRLVITTNKNGTVHTTLVNNGFVCSSYPLQMATDLLESAISGCFFSLSRR